MVEAGRLRLLSVWSPERASRFPEVPTLKELGYDMVVTSPYGVMGPKGMDAGVVRTLHDVFKEALDSEENRRVRGNFDMPLEYRNTADYAQFIRDRAAYEQAMIRRLNLSIG
jgi:tripartite-type tricarboxylate transporter receptor subunit TctC